MRQITSCFSWLVVYLAKNLATTTKKSCSKNRYMVWRLKDPVDSECVGGVRTEWGTHTAATSICLCGIQLRLQLYREKWAISGQVYHEEEDIMNRIRCRKSILSTGGSTFLRLKYAQGLKCTLFLIDSGICHRIMFRSDLAPIETQTVLIYY